MTPACTPCPTPFHGTRRQQEQGITLIEVLVAVIVLSIGLLGIAGLQVATTKYKLGSWARAATATLFADYADHVRINPPAAGPNSRTGGVLNTIPNTAANQSMYTFQATWAAQQAITTAALNTQLAAVACEGSTTSCTPANRASYDMLNWRKSVRESLPQGAVFVEGNRSTGINLTLMWMDKDNTDKSFRTNDGTTNTQATLVTASSCLADTDPNITYGLAQQTCCPGAAAVPAGVRCTRFAFMP
jgi:type IV pilus assembly protein PilV